MILAAKWPLVGELEAERVPGGEEEADDVDEYVVGDAVAEQRARERRHRRRPRRQTQQAGAGPAPAATARICIGQDLDLMP